VHRRVSPPKAITERSERPHHVDWPAGTPIDRIRFDRKISRPEDRHCARHVIGDVTKSQRSPGFGLATRRETPHSRSCCATVPRRDAVMRDSERLQLPDGENSLNASVKNQSVAAAAQDEACVRITAR